MFRLDRCVWGVIVVLFIIAAMRIYKHPGGCGGWLKCSCLRNFSICRAGAKKALEGLSMPADWPEIEEPHRITVDNPEKRIRDEFAGGADLRRGLNVMWDNLSSDQLSVTQKETTEEQMLRSFVAVDGAVPEGMKPPIAEFERNALARQIAAKPTIYADDVGGGNRRADDISMAGL